MSQLDLTCHQFDTFSDRECKTLKMFLKIVLLFVAFAAVSANRVLMRPCDNNQPMPEWFEGPTCSGSHCNMIRGQRFTGRAQVTLHRPWQTLNIALRARILTVNVPLSIAEGYDNACPFLEGKDLKIY